jgi:DNA-binding GntR family transcriptional regulator
MAVAGNESQEEELAVHRTTVEAVASENMKPETLGQHVYSRLRARIYRGDWLPGTKLTFRGLALELGTSVQPVREAIGRLAAERALILRPNHSVMLPLVDRTLLDEIFSMRNMLEGEAARLCAGKISDQDLIELRDAIAMTRMHFLAKGGSIQERILSVHHISSILARCSGSEILAEQISALRARTAPYYAAAMTADRVSDLEFLTFAIRMQDEFLFAMERRDAVNASELRKVDLYTYQHYVYRLLGLE